MSGGDGDGKGNGDGDGGGGDASALLDLDDVSFGYRADVPVVRNVRAALRDRRLTVLLGPNACGKSTLLKLMLGALKPASGEVRFLSRPLSAYRDAERAAQIAFVPQQTSSGFFFSVREVIAMGRFALRAEDDVLARVIEESHLGEIADQTFVELSSGQQQRVLVARAAYQLSERGRLVLLDEPVSAMDLYHMHATLRRLREYSHDRGAALAVLQDINLAAQYADDVWLMKSGELVRSGTWDEVLEPSALEEVYGVELDVLSAVPHESDSRGPSVRPRFEVRRK